MVELFARMAVSFSSCQNEFSKLMQFVSHFSDSSSNLSTMSTFIHSPASQVLRQACQSQFYTRTTWSTGVSSNGSSRYIKSNGEIVRIHPDELSFVEPSVRQDNLRDPPSTPKAKNNNPRYSHECTRYECMSQYRRPPANEESLQLWFR